VFLGPALLTIDTKGRMSIPTKHRDAIQTQYNGELTLTCHPDGCLLLFPRPLWLEKYEVIVNLPVSARVWKRIFLGNVEDVEMDSAGRVLISPALRAAAKIDREIKMMGLGEYFELWDPVLCESDKDNPQSQVTPDVLKHLNL